MSDNEEEEIIEQEEEGAPAEPEPDKYTSSFKHVNEFARTFVHTEYLTIPRLYMSPPRMSTSTEFARIIEPHEIVATPGPVLVLFAHGGTTMPEHFQKFIHCVGVVTRNCKNLAGFTYENDFSYCVNSDKGGKKAFVSGLNMTFKKAAPAPAVYERDFIQTTRPIICADTLATRQMGTNDVDIKQELCTIEWGMIPYRYLDTDNIEVRDVFQVLRVVPCYGLHFPQFIQAMLTNVGNRPSDKELDEASKMLLQILYVEMGYVGMSPFMFPAPLSSDSCLSPTSMVSLLSPFMLVRKMLRMLPGSMIKQNTLQIHGFPSMADPESSTDTILEYDELHKHYVGYLQVWCAEEKIDRPKQLGTLVYRDNAFVAFELAVTMQLYSGFKDVKDFHTKRILLPLLLSTLLTNFKFVHCDNDERWTSVRDRYIQAQCGTDESELTPVRLNQYYRSMRAVNYPEAGMYSGMRKAMESLLQKDLVADDMDTYAQYLQYCYTILCEQQVDGFFMSERVRHCAELLKRSKNTFCESTARAMRSFGHNMSRHEDYIMQQVVHDDIMHTTFLFQRGLCAMNKSTKATAINLGLVYACIISDVLCYLGMDNNSWTWCFFPILVCGGGGHLRAHTEDGHTQKTDCVYLAKASSVGFNAVVVSTMNSLLGLVSILYPELPPDVVGLMRLLKIDRATRVAIEESSAVQSANGIVFQVPEPSAFMRISVFDELARNASEDAINGLITSGFPRDKSGGGSTHKSVESKNRGPRELQETKILRGMGFYSILQAQNRNCSNATVAESYKALVAGAVACFVPSAQPSPGFPSLDETRRHKKHRCNIYESCNASGESQLPECKDTCQALAWTFTMLPMNCRSIGLLNKMAMSNVVVNSVEQQLYKWFGSAVYNFFRPLIGSMLTLSFWRVLNGYLSRGVASSLLMTNALQICVNKNFEVANFETVMHMECGIGLHALNNALLDGLTHLLDFNIVIVNKIIAHKLDTPCFPIEFIKALYANHHNLYRDWGAEYDALAEWLQLKLNSGGQGMYLAVPNLGEKLDYLFYEQYLEVYCSVVAGSFVTYQKAINECLGRVIDFSNFWSLDSSMLTRSSVAGRHIDLTSSSEIPPITSNFLHVIRRDKSEKYYVHFMQHLLLTSLMGDSPLHSDNIYSWGKHLMQLLINELGVRQQVPSNLLAHSFEYEYGHVVPSLVEFAPTRHYMMRSRTDMDAWMRGQTSELVGNFGTHCIEDVLHISGYVHLANMMGVGKTFEAQPFGALRPPELVPGRIYPMKSASRGSATICICPRGENHVLVHEERYGSSIYSLAGWSVDVLCHMGYQVAPLIFRPNAAICIGEKVSVLKPFVEGQFDGVQIEVSSVQSEAIRSVEKYNYLNAQGYYNVLGFGLMRWETVHESLLALGSWIYVSGIHHRGLEGSERVRGWLRYQDEADSDIDENAVYVAFRIARNIEGFDCTAILAIEPAECHLYMTTGIFCDFLLPEAI